MCLHKCYIVFTYCCNRFAICLQKFAVIFTYENPEIIDSMKYNYIKKYFKPEAEVKKGPVQKVIGNSFASRVSASLLNAIGLPELITYSEKEYEQLAIKLARNKKDLENIKNKLENNRSSKPLFNTNLFAKDMESAYETIYKRYLEDLKVENIEI